MFWEKVFTQTKDKYDEYHGYSAPSFQMVNEWFTELRCGRISTSNDKLSGVVVTDMILADLWMKVRENLHAILSHDSGFDSERSLVHVKGILKMGATLAHNKS